VEARPAFEDRLGQSPRNIERVEGLVNRDAPETAAEISALLRARTAAVKMEMAKNDALGSMLATSLADVAAPADLVSCLDESVWDTQWALEQGLQSHAGRTYLLERVGDPEETIERRRQFARILSDAVWTYMGEVRSAKAGDQTVRTDFMERLARLAMDHRGTDLCETLLRGFAPFPVEQRPTDGPLGADFDAAADVLCEAFPDSGPPDQFRIAATLMRVRPERYGRLLPDAGPLLTLAEPGRDFGEALGKRTLSLRCRFRNGLAVETEVKLVLRPADGTPDLVVSVDTRIGKMTNTFGDAWLISAAIPAGAAGKYRVFLRDYRDRRPNGDGLGFDVEIPRH
jgi:hypothetical protein